MGITKSIPLAESHECFERLTRGLMNEDAPTAATIEVLSLATGDRLEATTVRRQAPALPEV